MDWTNALRVTREANTMIERGHTALRDCQFCGHKGDKRENAMMAFTEPGVQDGTGVNTRPGIEPFSEQDDPEKRVIFPKYHARFEAECRLCGVRIHGRLAITGDAENGGYTTHDDMTATVEQAWKNFRKGWTKMIADAQEKASDMIL